VLSVVQFLNAAICYCEQNFAALRIYVGSQTSNNRERNYNVTNRRQISTVVAAIMPRMLIDEIVIDRS